VGLIWAAKQACWELIYGLIWVKLISMGLGQMGSKVGLGLLKYWDPFYYKDQQNILLKLKEKFVHYCPYYLG
jgi:hypothetical protein